MQGGQFVIARQLTIEWQLTSTITIADLHKPPPDVRVRMSVSPEDEVHFTFVLYCSVLRRAMRLERARTMKCGGIV